MSFVIFQNGKVVSNCNIEQHIALYTSSKQPEHLPNVAHNSKARGYIDNKDSTDNRRRLRASHVMSTSVVTCTPQTSIEQAITILNNQDFSHLVVVNDEQKPLAVVHYNQLIKDKNLAGSTISCLLQEDFSAVSSSALVRDIATLFIKFKNTALAVVDEKYLLVGIISQNDLMGLLVSSPHQQITV
jgi:CBS-domain-containing membrane protein